MTRTSATESLIVSGLAAALPVAADATTSRVVVDNERARVVAFVMAAGQELTDHASARPVLVLVTAGTLRFALGDDARDLAAGDAVWLAPGQRHALVATTDARFTLVMLAG